MDAGATPEELRALGARDLCGDRVERGAGRGDQPGADMHIARGGADGGMPEQHLDDAQIGASFQAVGCERMSQRVRRDPFGDAAVGERDAQGGLHPFGTHGLAGDGAGKQVGLLGTLRAVVLAQGGRAGRD